MSKKIIILNGSPRKAGNTTALTAEFKKGAVEAGNTVTEFFLDGMNINGCKGALEVVKTRTARVCKRTIWIKSIPFTRKRI